MDSIISTGSFWVDKALAQIYLLAPGFQNRARWGVSFVCLLSALFGQDLFSVEAVRYSMREDTNISCKLLMV